MHYKCDPLLLNGGCLQIDRETDKHPVDVDSEEKSEGPIFVLLSISIVTREEQMLLGRRLQLISLRGVHLSIT